MLKLYKSKEFYRIASDTKCTPSTYTVNEAINNWKQNNVLFRQFNPTNIMYITPYTLITTFKSVETLSDTHPELFI